MWRSGLRRWSTLRLTCGVPRYVTERTEQPTPIFTSSEATYCTRLGGKVKTKYIDPELNHEMVAITAGARGDYEKIEQILEKVKRPSIRVYNSLIKAYIRSQMYGKIALVLEKLDDPEQPDPNEESFLPLAIEYLNFGLKGHTRNVIMKAAENGAISFTGIYRLLDLYLKQDDLAEVLFFVRVMETTGIFGEELYDKLFEYISAQGTQGYELLKRYLVHFREITHAPLKKEFFEILLYSSVNSKVVLDPFYIQEYLLDNYPYHEPNGPNHVTRHLLKLEQQGMKVSDFIRRSFYRCVARGFRFSDDIVNEIVLHFHRQVDHHNVFNMYQVMNRDCYQIFPETFVPIVKSALQLGTEESLRPVPRLIMESAIPEDYRVSLLQTMVDWTTDPHQNIDLAPQLNRIYEYVKENTIFTEKINHVLLDYFLSQNDVDRARELINLTLQRHHTNKLKYSSPLKTRTEISQGLSAEIESFTKSSYTGLSRSSSSTAVDLDPVLEDYEPRVSIKSYEKYLKPELIEKYEGELSTDEFDRFLKSDLFKDTGKNKRGKGRTHGKGASDDQMNEADDALENFKSFSGFRNMEKLSKVKPNEPFFSVDPSQQVQDVFLDFGGDATVQSSAPSQQFANAMETEKQITYGDQPIMTFPEGVEQLSRNLPLESRGHMNMTGLEFAAGESVPESEELESIKSILDTLPRHTILEDLIEERFKLTDPNYEGHASEEFEYDAINEIQSRSRIPEDTDELIGEMWNNVLTYLVANQGQQAAMEFVDRVLIESPMAAPPSRQLCTSFGLSAEWRNKLE